MDNIIEDALYELVTFYIKEQTPFIIAVDNHNDWDNVLPDRLEKEKRFILALDNTDLSDSYIDPSGDIVIVAGIDDVVYTKVLTRSDIHAVGLKGVPPLITKQFITYPKKTFTPATEDGIAHSMAMFKKYNPEMF